MNMLVKVGRRVPAPIRETVLKAAQRSNRGLPGRRINWGDVARRAPFSSVYGWDRGLPVDRFYINAFVARNQHLVTGSVLESDRRCTPGATAHPTRSPCSTSTGRIARRPWSPT